MTKLKCWSNIEKFRKSKTWIKGDSSHTFPMVNVYEKELSIYPKAGVKDKKVTIFDSHRTALKQAKKYMKEHDKC